MGIGSTSVCNMYLGDLEQDKKRLEWLVKNEAFVSWITDHECYVSDIAGLMEAPISSIGWRDAIDEAMRHG